MSIAGQTLFTTIASGDQVSGTLQTKNGQVLGLWAPTIDSGDMFLQGSFDTTSANFVRITDPSLDPAGAADDGHVNDWKWAVGPGSKAIPITAPLAAYPALRLETSVAQTDTRTLALHVKL